MNIQYPYLPEGRTIKYVPAENLFMKEATRMRNEESTDMSHATGAVIVRNNEIIVRAANKATISNKRFQQLHKNGYCIRKLLKIPSGTKYWLCPGCARDYNHSESLASKELTKRFGHVDGADLYLFGHWWCCKPCWDRMIAAGIRDVYVVEGATEQFKR
jgi:deoxycytidylate deaminase